MHNGAWWCRTSWTLGRKDLATRLEDRLLHRLED
jgi:hypothetical protein